MSLLEKRLQNFVRWIATDADREDEIREQSNRIRERISNKAQEDDLIVRSTPSAGSYAKRTGLRQHLRGKSVVEGQDVDLPFVVSVRKGGEELTELIDRFDGYAAACFPSTERRKTKSSVELVFTGTGLAYDLVPMLATSDDQRQIIIQANGTRRETSVQAHTEFVRSRTRDTTDRGLAKFNSCVRLLKWWREFREDESSMLKDVPSMVMELVAAKALETRGAKTNVAETIADWSGWAANTVRNRKPVTFDLSPASAGDTPWQVCDPVNSGNNIVSAWRGWHVDEFAEWFENTRDLWNRAIRQDMLGDDVACLNSMVAIFGTPFRHHCD